MTACQEGSAVSNIVLENSFLRKHNSNYFPNEILGIILNELASDRDTDTYTNEDRTIMAALASCRLASHVLCSFATPLLFSSIQLRETSRWHRDYNNVTPFRKQALNLNQTLINNDIATSVQTMILSCHQTNFKDSINGTLIAAILHRLPHIRRFTLGGCQQMLEISSIGQDLATAIRALCRSPNLTTLNIYYIIDFPIMLITQCPNLRHLFLSYIDFYFDNEDETSSQELFYLDSLEIDEYSAFCLRLFRHISVAKYFSQIKNLKVNEIFVGGLYGWNIMLLASQSLETLKIYAECMPSHDVPFDLGLFPGLRHFKIHLPSTFETFETRLQFLNNLLSISSSTSIIETLEIKMAWIDSEDGYIFHEKQMFSPDTWSTLDETLACEQYVSLRKVVLDLYVKLSFIDDQQRTLPYDQVGTLFPMCRALSRTLEINLKSVAIQI